MAKLSKFKRDSSLTQTGEWIRVGDEYDDLEILTRGFNDDYTDHRNAGIRKAATLNYRGDPSKIGAAETRSITIDSIVAHSLIDVRNLADDDGNPVSLDKFVTMLRDPDYLDLYLATITACAMVGRTRAAVTKDAIKN